VSAGRWGDAKTYAWLWGVSGQQYQNQLLFYLECENPNLHKLVLKELGRDRKGNPHSSESKVRPEAQSLGERD
jgi:hypothetical protein